MIAPLARIVDQLRGEPSRTGSLIVTFHGDAILPRGGSVWLGTLLAFLDLIDIDGGSVRTAVSRLKNDGWLARHKIGRKSFYSLADVGHTRFALAMKHVYEAPASDWDGHFELYLVGTDADRDEARSRFEEAGFGSPRPGVWIAPRGATVSAPDAIRLEVSASLAMGRRLVAESWALERTAEAYRAFVRTFAPLRRFVERDVASLSPADAVLARVLMVHHYRRVVLHDPLLPAPLLPPDWPGGAARALCVDIYPALLPAAEDWLDRFGESLAGPLPPADWSLRGRFRPAD